MPNLRNLPPDWQYRTNFLRCLPSSKVYIPVAEVARQLAVSNKLVYKMFAQGKLPGIRVEGVIRISQEGVNAYITAHTYRVVEAQTKVAKKKPPSTSTVFKFFPKE